MADSKQGNVTRRTLLKAGAAIPLLGVAAPSVLAQAPLKSPTKVHDFMTNADVTKAEQEGQLVFYCHENEAGTAGIMEGFRKDFPKIDTSYVRAQTGALQQDPVERSAADLTSTSSSYPIWRRPSTSEKGGYERFSRDVSLQGRPSEFTGRFVSDRRRRGSPTPTKVPPGRAEGMAGHSQSPPKGSISCKISARFAVRAVLRCASCMGRASGKSLPSRSPCIRSRVQLFDRLAKGDDMMTALSRLHLFETRCKG